MIPLPYLLGGILIALLIVTLVCVLWFFTIRFVIVSKSSALFSYEALIILESRAVLRVASLGAKDLLVSATIAQRTVFQNAFDGLLGTISLAILAALAVIVLVWQHSVVVSYVVAWQCTIAPVKDKLVLQVVNVGALIYDIVNPLVVAVYRSIATFTFVPLTTLFSCTDTSVFRVVLLELGHSLASLLHSLIEILDSDTPLDEPFDTIPFWFHIGNAFKALKPVLDCFCEFFNFVWIPVLQVPSFPSIHTLLDCGTNFLVVRLLQLIFRPFVTGGDFDPIPWGDEGVCTWLSIADVQQHIVLQTGELFFGSFSEVLTPCSLFDDNPTECNALGHCKVDVHTNLCRSINPCDAHATRDTCTGDLACCFEAFDSPSDSKVRFSCSAASEGYCPKNTTSGQTNCSALPDVTTCMNFGGVCLWNNIDLQCVPHEEICTGFTNDAECRAIPSYCDAFVDESSCNAFTNDLCYWTGLACTSRAGTCIETQANPNTTCVDLQLCGWNYNQSTCYARDVNASIVTGVSSAGKTQTSWTVPGADSPPDTIGKLIGVPIVLAVMEVQWAHTSFGPGNELGAFLIALAVTVLDVIVNGNKVFTRYDGMKRLRLGYLFDFLRSWTSPVADLGVILDKNIPCTFQPLLRNLPDFIQGLAEIFFLIIYFSIFQPTGPASSIVAWLPFDFLASYWNDKKVSFKPLIFVNGTTGFPWDFQSTSSNLYGNCVNGTIDSCELTINLENDMLTVNGLPYSWDNVSLSGTTISHIDVFPGIDRTLPRIFKNVMDSAECAERVVGDGTNTGEERVPWACALKHGVNVFGEIMNITGQMIFYTPDIIRFDDTYPYRRTPLDIYFEGFYDEWAKFAHCLTNIIRLLEFEKSVGLCKISNINTGFAVVPNDSFVCCLADLVELFLAGPGLATFNEFALFIRDLVGIKFIVNRNLVFHLPDVTRIIERFEATIDKFACSISAIIPNSFACPLDIDDDLTCTLFTGTTSVYVKCSNPDLYQCSRGNQCLSRFIATVLRLFLAPFKIANLFYVTIRSLITSRCEDKQTEFTCNSPCTWDASRVDPKCRSPVINIQTAESVIHLIVGMIQIPLGSIMEIGYRFAVLFDCIVCAAEKAAKPTVADADLVSCKENVFFSFYDLIFGSLFAFLNSLLTLLVTTIVILVTVIIAVVTGNFDLIGTIFTELGSLITDSFDDLGKRILVGVVKFLHLEELYQGIQKLVDSVIIPICNVISDIVTWLNETFGFGLDEPQCNTLKLPPLSFTIPGLSETDCVVIDSESICKLAGCVWDPSIPDLTHKCRAKQGCEKGSTRETCVSAARELSGNDSDVSRCFYQVGANSTQNGTSSLPRVQACGDSIMFGFPLANESNVNPNLGQCALCSSESNALACLQLGVCTPVSSTGPGGDVFQCLPSPTLCNDHEVGCNHFNSNRSGCNEWPGVCFWLPSTDECVPSTDLCSRPSHTLLTEPATFSPYSHGGQPVANNFCSLMIDLCLPYANQSECEDPMNRQLCTWTTELTAGAFYIQTVSPSSFSTRNLAVFASPESGICVGTPGYKNLINGQPLGSTMGCRPVPDTSVHSCVTMDVYERIQAGVSSSDSRLRELKRKRDATGVQTLLLPWDENDACIAYARLDETTLHKLIMNLGVKTLNGTFDEAGLEIYCVGRIMWSLPRYAPSGQQVNQSKRPRAVDYFTRSECDLLFEEYYNISATGVSWNELRPLEKYTLVECVKWRVVGEYIRQKSGLSWLPSDITYNSYRKWQLMASASRGYTVYRQYQNDRGYTPDVVLSEAYRNRTRSAGLSTALIEGLSNEDELRERLAMTTLYDYFLVNNMTLDEYRMIIDLMNLANVAKSATTETLDNVLLGLTQNITRIDFLSLFVNGTGKEMAQLLATSTATVVTEAYNMTKIAGSLALNPETYKRSFNAAKGIGKLIFNTAMILRKWVTENGTLSQTPPTCSSANNCTGVSEAAPEKGYLERVSELPVVARWGQNIRIAYSMLWRNRAAAERRAKIGHFGEQVKFLVRLELVAVTAKDPVAARKAVIESTPVHIRSYVRDPEATGLIAREECLTNVSLIGTTWFCDHCPVADGILGREIRLGVWLFDYFTRDPQPGFSTFRGSHAKFRAVADYLSDENAPVQVGGNITNPMRWPYNDRPWLELFNDDTPNKKRFYDYGDLIFELFDSAKEAASDPNSLLVTELFESTINGLFNSAVVPAFNLVSRATMLTNVLTNTTKYALLDSSPEASSYRLLRITASNVTRPPGEVLADIGMLLFSQGVTCSFPVHYFDHDEGEITGVGKRFAIGEVLAVAVMIVIIVGPLLLAASVSGLITAMSAMFMMIGILGMFFLTITYNWSFLCAPALPQPLGDDIRDLAVYSLAPKCAVIGAGTLIGEYNSTNCYSCEAAKQRKAISCRADLGFNNVFDNIAFMTVAWFPELPETLRSWGLGSLVDNTSFGRKLVYWDNLYDPTNAELYAQLWDCNWLWTIIPYLFITAFLIRLAFLASPYFYVIWDAIGYAHLLGSDAISLITAFSTYATLLLGTMPFEQAYGVTADQFLMEAHSPDTDLFDKIRRRRPRPRNDTGSAAMLKQWLAETALGQVVAAVAGYPVTVTRQGYQPVDVERPSVLMYDQQLEYYAGPAKYYNGF